MSKVESLADLLEELGGISPSRIRLQPPPGTATEADVISAERRDNRLCELVDGVLVEKAMGFRESLLAAALIEILRAFVVARNLGVVTAPDGMMRLSSGLVRFPDVAFVSWRRMPGQVIPDDPIPHLVPDLAIEVLSESNTQAEIDRTIAEYFAAGVRLVWIVDRNDRTIKVLTSPDQSQAVDQSELVDGGEVLPGFQLDVRELFADLDRRGSA